MLCTTFIIGSNFNVPLQTDCLYKPFNEIKKNKKKCLIGFLIDFVFCRMAETTLGLSISHVTFPGSDVSLGCQCGCHLRFFSKLCMRVVDKKVNYAGHCVAAICNNSQTSSHAIEPQ